MMERLKNLKIFRNKYLFTITFFLVYMLFLDDVDAVKIYRLESKLNKLKQEKVEISKKYEETKNILNQLDDPEALEKYAREKKFFKHDDEDIFIIVDKDEQPVLK